MMKLPAVLSCVMLVACGGGGDSVADDGQAAARSVNGESVTQRAAALPLGHASLGLSLATLQRLSQSFGTPHQAIPAGVPGGYDWRERSRRGQGNNVPAGFKAFTGWAQSFWIDGAPVGTQKLEVRQYQTLLCTLSAGTRRWQRVQQGDIEGAAFRADYLDNLNGPAEVEQLAPGHWRVGFGAGRAYHFWARQGRAALTGDPLCGILVVFEARAVDLDGRALPAGTAATLLVGGGADYWLNTTAAWDQYRTNADVGIGVLRRVGAVWDWHGMGTADKDALAQLARDGFVDRATP